MVSASSEYKFKLINIGTYNTRRTTLAPSLGGYLTKLQIVPTKQAEYKDKLMFYQTASQQVGLIKMPLDGNPHRVMALIAHPSEVSCV